MAIQIYDPTTEVAARRIAFAPRPKSLAGLSIGLVDNTKHNSDLVSAAHRGAARSASTARSGTSFVKRKARGAAPHAEILEELKGSLRRNRRGRRRLRVMQLGHVLDSIVFEQHGMPSASIVTGCVQSDRSGDGPHLGPS